MTMPELATLRTLGESLGTNANLRLYSAATNARPYVVTRMVAVIRIRVDMNPKWNFSPHQVLLIFPTVCHRVWQR